MLSKEEEEVLRLMSRVLPPSYGTVFLTEVAEARNALPRGQNPGPPRRSPSRDILCGCCVLSRRQSPPRVWAGDGHYSFQLCPGLYETGFLVTGAVPLICRVPPAKCNACLFPPPRGFSEMF